MIDLHCHLLPGIDDGPKTMQEAVDMAMRAVDEGIHHAVVTPHIQPGCYDNDRESIRLVYETFKQELQQRNIPLSTGMAAEVRVCGELPQMIIGNKVPFLGKWQDKNVILLEFPHDHVPIGAEKLVQWLQTRNILPLIAHPERNQGILRQPAKIEPFIELGCLLQITASSVCGLFGAASRDLALQLIEEDVVTVMASDAHNLLKRQPALKAAVDILAPYFGEERVMKLVVDHPSVIINAVPA